MLRREAMREYLGGALWVMPFAAGVLALIVANVLMNVEPADGTCLRGSRSRGRRRTPGPCCWRSRGRSSR